MDAGFQPTMLEVGGRSNCRPRGHGGSTTGRFASRDALLRRAVRGPRPIFHGDSIAGRRAVSPPVGRSNELHVPWHQRSRDGRADHRGRNRDRRLRKRAAGPVRVTDHGSREVVPAVRMCLRESATSPMDDGEDLGRRPPDDESTDPDPEDWPRGTHADPPRWRRAQGGLGAALERPAPAGAARACSRRSLWYRSPRRVVIFAAELAKLRGRVAAAVPPPARHSHGSRWSRPGCCRDGPHPIALGPRYG